MDTNKSLKKSFNKYTKKYRFQRAKQNNNNWYTMFFDKKTALFIIQQKFISSDFKFRLYTYKFYFGQSIIWFFKRKIFLLKRYTKTKKNITDLLILIIGTIISYAILKFILHWL